MLTFLSLQSILKSMAGQSTFPLIDAACFLISLANASKVGFFWSPALSFAAMKLW